MNEIESRIRESGIVAILRGDFPPARLAAIIEGLQSGGVRVLEVTLNSANALQAIEAARRQAGDHLLVGAGTVRTPEDVEAAIGAGAMFLVSPNFDPTSVALSRRAGILHLPGAFTPSEVQAAFAAGCPLVKLFPADALGPAYLRAIRAPLDDVGLVAVGGIGESNLGDYIRAGAVAVGVGSALVRGAADEQETIATRARGLVHAFQQARPAGIS
ncbi:MAG TPA: bifunctional 4-hydroxy-2-oxoglutarate aldolase/2-dehydro-3-deoxy-phosphogluconate aldolase [Longimicrobiaceae bacterium]|nr:bifunctional 4-hydroxy-2-oxoglutarate aldolase/2-dehydro-3-deoxy-phosphogluconate aldolase [Longimicrobiaceae bacterium]